jgi:hypothetical protein
MTARLIRKAEYSLERGFLNPPCPASHTSAGTNTVVPVVSGPAGTNALTRPGYTLVTNARPVTITIQRSGPNVQVLWPTGTLQTARGATGPFTNITGASSPFSLAPSNTAQFFRVRVP